MTGPTSTDLAERVQWEQIALVDILDRVLATGVVISGEVTLSIADVDLVHVSLHALVSSVRPEGPGPLWASRP
jgi:Gas vesicle protein